MRYKFTVLLLFLNFATFGLIIYLGQRAESDARKEGRLSNVIGREIVEADRIEIRGQGLEEARVLERQGAAWSITEPIQWSANYFAVNRILNQLQFLEEEAAFSIEEMQKTGQTLADYGLENPLLTIVVGHDEQSIELRVGSPTEIGNNVYLLGPDREKIYVISKNVVGSLLVDLADLRTREVFDIPVFEVNSLSLQINTAGPAQDGSLKVRLARTTEGWMFEAPLSAKADPALVSTAINKLTAAKAIRFIEPEAIDPVLLGFESPSMRVTLQGNKRRQTLLVGNADISASEPAYFAKLEDNPTAFTLAAKPFDDLRLAQDALRERNILNFKPEALSAIDISNNGLQIRLQKLENGGWHVVQSDTGADIQPRRADPEIISTLISELLALRATGFAVDAPLPGDLEQLGFNEPRRTVKLSFNGDTPLTLTLAHPENENDKLYARSSAAEYVYEVDRRATLRMLPLNSLSYRDRTLESLPEAAVIRSIRLERLSDESIILERDSAGGPGSWQIALANLPEEEASATLTLVEAIRNFRVAAYLKDEYTDGYQLDNERTLPWAYRLSAEILFPGGDTPQVERRNYVFSDRLSGTLQAGGSPLHNTIFQINQELLDALYELTDTMELPPEAKGEAVPEPEPVEPVPAPEMPASPSE